MYVPITQLEEINSKSRIQLTKTLSIRHGVRVVAGRGEETEDGCRGLAFFLAFDPWETCLRCPPGSVRFFDAAERTGLLSAQEASLLSRALLSHGSEIAKCYDGAFRGFFSAPRVKAILNNIDNLDHLSESGLAIGGSWADRLFENCPFPLYPANHLEFRSFRRITIEEEIEFYASSPWLAWIEALDLICHGCWAGFKPSSVLHMVKVLGQRIAGVPPELIDIEDAVLGQKVILPMFSHGLQGVVLGIFTDVPKAQMEPILTSLLQFGASVSDVYADLRWREFVEALEHELDEDGLAREMINMISPIARIIVARGGRRAGYRIANEGNYWAGYARLASRELVAPRSEHGFVVAGPNGAEIYIEPLTDVPNLNPEFMRIRIENFLNQTLGSVPAAQTANPLAFAEIRRLRLEFEDYAQDERVSIAKLRQLYVIQKIEKFWHKASVKISNSEMKGFLESRGRDAKNGYQVTSFTAELERIFAGKVVAAKTRNSLSLTWKKGVSPIENSRNT